MSPINFERMKSNEKLNQNQTDIQDVNLMQNTTGIQNLQLSVESGKSNSKSSHTVPKVSGQLTITMRNWPRHQAPKLREKDDVSGFYTNLTDGLTCALAELRSK
jgi:hypothetical protein